MEYTLEEYLKINHNLIYKIVNSYAKISFLFGIELDDLYQEAYLSLIKSYNRYDSSQGPLYTYTYLIIKGAVLNYISINSTCTHIPRELLRLANIFYKEMDLFYKNNGRYMTDIEQENYVRTLENGSYKNKLELLKKLRLICEYHYKDKVSSLEETFEINDFDDYTDSEERLAIKDCIPSCEDIEEEILSKTYVHSFLDSIDYLAERNKNIWIESLGLYDNDPKKDTVLTKKYSLSRQRINKICHRTEEIVKSKL